MTNESNTPVFYQIITSLLETDLYKFSMGQVIYHQFPSYMTTWTFKCRNQGVFFTPAMVEEIKKQIKMYCQLRFQESELEYLSEIKWLKPDYIEFLRLWRPNFDDFEISQNSENGLAIETHGTWLNTSMYEIPVLAIVNEVYFKMRGYIANDPTARNLYFNDLLDDFRGRLDAKFEKIQSGRWQAGTFSEFGLRRRLSGLAQEMVIRKFKRLVQDDCCRSKFIGTSNVYLAKKYNITPVGTMAHEFIMCVGQGNQKHNPAYSNWYALNAWIREYGILNGITLTDTIGTDAFLKDFQLTFATLFSGVRHDSGSPVEWGEKMLKHYKALGIDPINKTLLFSDSLDFKKADLICRHFQDRCQIAFGIGTYLSNNTCVSPLNIVMKVTECNNMPVAKLSDAPGKSMCKDKSYIEYLERTVEWRMNHPECERS